MCVNSVGKCNDVNFLKWTEKMNEKWEKFKIKIIKLILDKTYL